MENTLDARGLSCPQPVMIASNKIRELGKGEIKILVDTDTAKENVSRAAVSRGWTVADIKPEEQGYCITIRRE